jgi:glycosyltransferase involved in cell wall biosynthesis
LVLASDREGMANVLLESLACGTPVVATAAWGTPEVLAHPSAGVLVHSRSGEGIANGSLQLFAKYPKREDTRRYAESFSWDATTAGQLRLFEQAIASHGRSGRPGVAGSLSSVDSQVRS